MQEDLRGLHNEENDDDDNEDEGGCGQENEVLERQRGGYTALLRHALQI